jgi:hypothetical protein
MHLLTIISGGQTGADRAALDFAIARGIEHGGWCSAGRRAETESARYRVRTVRNVRDGDATLILNLGELEGGSRETQRIAERQGKSVRVVQVDAPTTDAELHELREWLRVNAVARLNVAGPRESKRPGVYQAALSLLERLFPTAE